MPCSGADPGFFLGGGAQIFFFFAEYQLYKSSQRGWGVRVTGGGGVHPPHRSSPDGLAPLKVPLLISVSVPSKSYYGSF